MRQTSFNWGVRKRHILIAMLVLALGLGLGIRLYDLTDLPLDFAPTRQLFSALKARSIYYSMLPESANVPEWKQEMAAQQMTAVIEPPIIETIVALTYRVAGEHLWIARIYSSLFWVVAGIFLFMLARELASTQAAIFSLLFYLFLPYGVVASRSFQPDPLMTALIVAAAWGLYRWRSSGMWKWALIAGLLTGMAIFAKNVAVFPLGLAALTILLERGWRESLKDRQAWLFAVLSLLPVTIFTLYGVYTGFLGGQFGLRFFPELWSTGGFYLRWLGQIESIAGLGSFAVAIAGVFIARRREMALLAGLWLGYIAFGMVFAYFVITHDYYNLMLVPLIALSLAPVADVLLERAQSIRAGWIPRAVFSILVVFIVAVQLWNVRVELDREDWRPDAEFWSMLGEKLGHGNGVVVLAVAQDYGYRLAYWGWQNVDSWYSTGDLDMRALDKRTIDVGQRFQERAQGKQFMIVTQMKNFNNQPEIKAYVYEYYPIYSEGKGYVIFDLAHPKTP